MENIFFKLLARLQKRDMNGRSPSPFTSGKSSIAAMNLLAQIICSDPIILFAFVIMQVVLLNIFVGQR